MASEARDNHVRLVVEYPGIVPLGRAAPGQEAGVEAFRIGRIQEFNESRQTPCTDVQRQSPAQCLIEVGQLPDRKRSGHWTREHAQPALKELDVQRRRLKAQRIKARGLPVLERAVLPFQRPYEDLQPPVLVENDLRRALAREQRNQKPDEYGLTGPGRPANEGMARILARAAIRIRGVTGMEGEVKRRSGARHEYRQGITPVIAARPSCRVVVKRRHAGKVPGRDGRLARAQREIARQLPPEAASSARSSRATVMPVSASRARASAT